MIVQSHHDGELPIRGSIQACDTVVTAVDVVRRGKNKGRCYEKFDWIVPGWFSDYHPACVQLEIARDRHRHRRCRRWRSSSLPAGPGEERSLLEPNISPRPVRAGGEQDAGLTGGQRQITTQIVMESINRRLLSVFSRCPNSWEHSWRRHRSALHGRGEPPCHTNPYLLRCWGCR